MAALALGVSLLCVGSGILMQRRQNKVRLEPTRLARRRRSSSSNIYRQSVGDDYQESGTGVGEQEDASETAPYVECGSGSEGALTDVAPQISMTGALQANLSHHEYAVSISSPFCSLYQSPCCEAVGQDEKEKEEEEEESDEQSIKSRKVIADGYIDMTGHHYEVC